MYAYSVDDAVGNMQVAGDGLILAVGGANGLPNPNPATPFINVSFGGATTDRVQFTKYGVCTIVPNKMVNPDFRSFAISSTNPNSCPLSWVDNSAFGNQYTFKLKYQPKPPPPPAPQTPAWPICQQGDTKCETPLNPATLAPTMPPENRLELQRIVRSGKTEQRMAPLCCTDDGWLRLSPVR